MQVSFNQAKAITDTLPIGLYANRRIDAVLQEGEDCSYYNPETDNIVISYEQLTMGLEKINDEQDIEMVIRSNFYHEVSHAIITPKEMRPTEWLNIFEDERIETVLNGFYYGTNFDKAKRLICGYEPNYQPQDAMEAFFYCVRFRECAIPSYVKEVEQIIKKFATLHRNSEWWGRKIGVCHYINEVQDLWLRFYKDCQKRGMSAMCMPMPSNEPSQTQGQPTNMKGDNAHNPMAQKSPIDNNTILEMFSDSLNAEFDDNFHKALSMIFENYRKKNSKGSALNGYSGVINPRQVNREDYRFFERSSSIRGNNQFGSFHLNLFIDISGSFDNNTTKTNQIIKSLAILERKNPNFTFDIVATNTHSKILPKGKRFIKCSGGTYLGKEIEPIYRDLQKPQTYNYNIILFDGDAYCSGTTPSNRYDTEGMGFRTFANNNCTIISDNENRCYIEKYAPNTKTIYTNNYTDELLDNILKVMQKALS